MAVEAHDHNRVDSGCLEKVTVSHATGPREKEDFKEIYYLACLALGKGVCNIFVLFNAAANCRFSAL